VKIQIQKITGISPCLRFSSYTRNATKEFSMIRIFYRTRALKTVVYGIAATIAWVLTTVYYLLSASH